MNVTVIAPTFARDVVSLTLGVPFLITLDSGILRLTPIPDVTTIIESPPPKSVGLLQLVPTKLNTRFWSKDVTIGYYSQEGKMAPRPPIGKPVYYTLDGTFVIDEWQIVVPVADWIHNRYDRQTGVGLALRPRERERPHREGSLMKVEIDPGPPAYVDGNAER